MHLYLLHVERISYPTMAFGRLRPHGVDVKIEDA